MVNASDDATIPIDLNPKNNTIKLAIGVKTVVMIFIICKNINLSWQVTTAVYGVAEKLMAVLSVNINTKIVISNSCSFDSDLS